MAVIGGGEGTWVDLIFGVQWSWIEREELANEMKSLSDCVTRRLDQGKKTNLISHSLWAASVFIKNE